MKRFFSAIAIALFVAVLSGCASILEGEVLSETVHSGAARQIQPEDRAEVSDYFELCVAITELIAQHEETGLIYAYSYDGDIQADLDRACSEIKNDDPLGAYAVSEITGTATKIVSYFEIEIDMTFKRTKKQIDSIVNVSTLRYLRSEILPGFMGEYLDEAVIRTSIRGVTAEDIEGYIREIYYQNPRSIVIMPGVTAEAFPPEGDEKIIELRFGNIESSGIMRLYSTKLTEKVRLIAETVGGGDDDGVILLALAELLLDASVYDDGMAKTMSEHGVPNFAATAYGALINGSAVGEGFAMAYKALCDELGFECRVVLGKLDGMVHAWNIVALGGSYYHIDVSMSAAGRLGDGFMKNDETLSPGYTWDKENTVKCTGTLTYNDILSSYPSR